MSNTTEVSATFDRSISIQYLPYPEEQDKNQVMQAGQFLFPNFTRIFEISCKVSGKDKEGVDRMRYFTGLEPSDYPEAERDEISKIKEELEKHFGPGSLDPFNVNFWREKRLEINKKTTFLNMNSPEDKLTYYLIRGGGYREIASTYDMALDHAVPKRWYMIDANDYAEMDVDFDRKINKAIAVLENIEETKGFDDMLLLHKLLITSDRGTTKKTPKALLYKDLSDFIHGKIVKSSKKLTARQFLEAAEMLKKNKKELYITVYVKEANYFNFLTVTDDNQIKNVQTGTKYGTTTEKAVAYLSNPANQAELDNIKERVEAKWIQ